MLIIDRFLRYPINSTLTIFYEPNCYWFLITKNKINLQRRYSNDVSRTSNIWFHQRIDTCNFFFDTLVLNNLIDTTLNWHEFIVNLKCRSVLLTQFDTRRYILSSRVIANPSKFQVLLCGIRTTQTKFRLWCGWLLFSMHLWTMQWGSLNATSSNRDWYIFTCTLVLYSLFLTNWKQVVKNYEHNQTEI